MLGGVRLAGQSWSKWLLWLPKTLRNTVKNHVGRVSN